MRAVLFDLDGTLVDSEGQTDDAVAVVMARHGHPGAALPPHETRGRTWADVVRALTLRFPLDADPTALEQELVAAWAAHVDDVEPIPGSPEAVREAAAVAKVGVVSSSPRALVERVLRRLGVDACVNVVIGAEDVTRPKPAPDCFLAAAARLHVKPEDCVVVEDSSAGLTAAKGAGMKTRLVLYKCAEPERCLALADDAFPHYAALPPSYWRDLITENE